MSTRVDTEYCSFTKAVEHLGDRWSLLILRELAMGGPLGFNALAASVPGRISRSVLTERLGRLRDLGVVARDEVGAGRGTYRLTSVGEGLIPTLMTLRDWADAWLPDDPAMIERDPAIVLAWLAERVTAGALPERQAIVELRLQPAGIRSWLVVEGDATPYGCLEDPLLDPARYVYVDGGAAVLMALARGRREWRDAIADGAIEVSGAPELVAALPSWFRPALPVTGPPARVPGRGGSTMVAASRPPSGSRVGPTAGH